MRTEPIQSTSTSTSTTYQSIKPHHHQSILNSIAPQLMNTKLLTNPSFNPSLFNHHHHHQLPSHQSFSPSSITRTVKSILPNSLGGNKSNLNHLLITDPHQIDALLQLDLPSSTSNTDQPYHQGLSFWTGFRASLPSAFESKLSRRKRRAELGERILGIHQASDSLGLYEKFEIETGRLSNPNRNHRTGRQSIANTEKISNKKKGKAKYNRRKTDIGILSANHSKSLPEEEEEEAEEELSVEELKEELKEIIEDQTNLKIRKELVTNDLGLIDGKISRLLKVKEDLERSILSLKEEELELIDEFEGVEDRLMKQESKMNFKQPQSHAHGNRGGVQPTRLPSTTSRRRRGPAFLPSEHDQLPKNVSFMTLKGHTKPISALDFTTPYGQLVSASVDQSLRVWDLVSGEEIQELVGHKGMVKCLQVEDQSCITAGIDGQIRIWDLSIDPDDGHHPSSMERSVVQKKEDPDDPAEAESLLSPCVRKLEGHTQPITALYFDHTCLVTGSSDKTIRQWDLETGQNVLTMDILWAMQHYHPASSRVVQPSTSISDFDFDSRLNKSLEEIGLDDGHDAEHEFVGGIQFWGYALASGSADGCVRMWDMRTGQAHRTLVGHTGPIRCLQFDEMHLMSGSVDKTIKVWDLRTGTISDTIKYFDSITSLQFDSRKIVSTSGTNHINVYNRTTLEHSKIDEGNGHLDVVERLRYLDRYLISGGKDGLCKVWSI